MTRPRQPIRRLWEYNVRPCFKHPHTKVPHLNHESFTPPFCLATRRCMNFGPSFLLDRTPQTTTALCLRFHESPCCPVVYLADQPTPPMVRLRCYHHGCEETICWVQKTQAVGCGAKSDNLLLYRSRTDGDREGSKAAENQQEQLRGVRRSKRSSPDSPLTPSPL